MISNFGFNFNRKSTVMHQKVTIWVNYHHTEEVQRGNGRVCFSGNGCTYSSNEYDDEFLEQILSVKKKK